MKRFDSKKQIDIAILDFSKAFDTVPHERLLKKLMHYGIDGQTWTWIAAFLRDHTQCVVVDGISSTSTSVDSGVPQGTVLGPLLFLLYINDLPQNVTSQVRLFADDCLLYRSVKCTQDQLDLQRDLTSLHEWSLKWGMNFNPSKCVILSMSRSESKLTKFYTLDGVILEHVQEAKYLGVILSEDLKWAKHIQFITAKANSTLGLLRRNVHHCPEKLREQAFISLVRSRLEYSSTVWDPYLAQDIDKIEMVQRRGARYVKQEFHHMASVTALLKDLQWPELAERRREARLALMYKIIHGKVAIPVDDILKQPDKRTRKNHTFTYRHLDPNIEQFWNSFSLEPYQSGTIYLSLLCARIAPTPSWLSWGRPPSALAPPHEHYTHLPRIAHYSSRSRDPDDMQISWLDSGSPPIRLSDS